MFVYITYKRKKQAIKCVASWTKEALTLLQCVNKFKTGNQTIKLFPVEESCKIMSATGCVVRTEHICKPLITRQQLMCLQLELLTLRVVH